MPMNDTIVQNIKHVIVLMLENRSFDHIFGYFPKVDGIGPGIYNLANPNIASSQRYKPYPIDAELASQKASWINPQHSFWGMIPDIFGPGAIGVEQGKALHAPLTEPAHMGGFVAANARFVTIDNNKQAPVMSAFEYIPMDGTTVPPGRLNVLHTLAENFVLCDNWFCDTPAFTVPNRYFMHAATNRGNNGENPTGRSADGQPFAGEKWNIFCAKTIYESLDGIRPPILPDEARNWAMYGIGGYDSNYFAYTNPADPNDARYANAHRTIFEFEDDVASDRLPFYSFLMPFIGFDEAEQKYIGNSMHPECDARYGENYIAAVYNLLRASPVWDKCLVVVTFDENGGLHDHVKPLPAEPPDDIVFTSYMADVSKPDNFVRWYFDYTISGPRIPALLISPWLQNGKPGADQPQIDGARYFNTSILRFVQDLLVAQTKPGADPVYLTQRDRTAGSFADSSFWPKHSPAKPPHGDLSPSSIAPYPGLPVWGAPLPPRVIGPPGATAPAHPVDADRDDVEFEWQSWNWLPGHPDSGRDAPRRFESFPAFQGYVGERARAAARFYAEHCPRQGGCVSGG